MINVSTRPSAGLPALRRARSSSVEIFADVVSASLMIVTAAAR
jgi:hypothetical protein